MRITILSGSPRKKDGYSIIKEIEKVMSEIGNEEKSKKVKFEMIDISKMNVKLCTGCMQCFSRGDAFCPLSDDVRAIKQTLVESDGIILISPVYALHVTSAMKLLIDRLSFLCHRPELIGTPILNIVTTDGGGQKPTLSYLKMISTAWGGHWIGNIDVVSPMYFSKSVYYNSKYAEKVRNKIEIYAQKLHSHALSDTNPKPTIYEVLTFHGLKSKTFMQKADHDYWNSRGWLESDYYYPVQVNPFMKLMGKCLDIFIQNYFRKNYLSGNVQG